MSGFTGLGVRANGVLMQDRDNPGVAYALHSERCHGEFLALLREHDISARFVEYAPTDIPDGERCDWGKCDHG